MIRSLAIVLITWASLAPTAFAQDAPPDDAARAQAREQFALGVERYEANDHRGALEAFQEAYRLAPHPNVRVNMANCYEQLNRPLEAFHHFERFLVEAETPSRQQRREVEAALTRLRQQVGEVRFAIAPDGAQVTIDAAETRLSPILDPVRLTAGTHHVEVRMDGYRTARREIQVVGGQAERVSFALEPGEDEPVAALAPSEEPVDEGPAEAEVSISEEPAGGGFEFRLTAPSIIAGSAAIAFTATAIITGALALDANGAFEDAVARSNAPGASQQAREQARSDGLAASDRANTLSIVTDVFIIGAIAAAGITTFFIIVDGMDTEDEAQIALTPSAGQPSPRHSGRR